MKPSPLVMLGLVAFTALTAELTARAGPLKAVMDCADKKGWSLDKEFQPYPAKPQTIFRDDMPGLRFYLPPEAKDAGQTMLYSKFAIAGDFEITATFDWLEVTPPKTGYGMSCGISVDTGGPGGTVSLARADLVGKGDGFAVTRGLPKADKKGLDYKMVHFESDRTKKGRLFLKRVGDKLSCKAGEGELADLPEIYKVKFTDATVKKVRFFADQGKSPTGLDVYMGDIMIKAEEITHDIPLREKSGWFLWLMAGIAFVVISAIFVFFYLRQRRDV